MHLLIKLITTALLTSSLFAVCQTPNVKFYGALREIMFEGNLSGRVSLATLKEQPHLYGLGALKDLEGEILVLDGKAYISRVADGKVVISNAMEDEAALLVTAQVVSWSAHPISDAIENMDQLESLINKYAISAGLAPDKPFPFRIEGNAQSAEWHVIKWPAGDTHHTHAKHKASGLHGKITGTIEVLGFYSEHHKAIFTHHTRNSHLHVLNQAQTLAGHLDNLALTANAVLYLPSPTKK